MWEHREALGLTTTLTLEDLELHENHVLTVNAGGSGRQGKGKGLGPVSKG